MSTSATISGSFAHRYTIERELGRGATSTVYLANDTTAARDVALKVLRRELAQSVAADRFLREVRLNQSLQHRYITPVLDSGEFEGDLFLVLPHMQDGSLRQLLERERQLSIEAVLEVVRSIGEGLQYAHERGLIHRDVKPENILFAGNQAYLADFGIARAIQRASGDTTTEAGVVRGTPGYMSPEQASGDRNYDGRSDQYSFACVVYEMLAGVPAFHGPTPEATIALRFRHPARKLNVYRATVPAAVEGVIEKAMAIAPADRYASVGDFVRAFEAAVAAPADAVTSAVLTSPPGHRRAWLAATVIGLVALVSVAAAYVVEPDWFSGGSLGDSTEVVVFPFDTAGAAPGGPPPQEMMHAALRRWQDIQVVSLDQTLNALQRRHSTTPSPEDFRRVASSLGARRFVVGRVLRTPAGRALLVDYRDAALGSIHVAQLDLPSDSSGLAATYAALTDSLLLRGATDGSTSNSGRSHHLFAEQAFIRAATARGRWDLTTADSELSIAVARDPGYARGYLWQAQEKSWRGVDAQGWVALAERALSDSLALDPSERLMADALVQMGRGRFPNACASYKRLISQDSMSFVGWYGLGECNQNDRIVVPDARSPSQWRFRGSLQQAISSYVRAFRLIPATYRGFQQDGYRRLREILFTSGHRVTAGYSLGEPRRSFLGMPALSGDTVELIPWERDAVLRQRIPTASPPAVVDRLRGLFDTVATRWAGAFPMSSEAKEALAVSLELRGEPAALDSMASAERLATDPQQRLRLVAARLALQLKFAMSASDAQLVSLRNTADSLLEAHRANGDAEAAALLAPVAAMLGRCARTSDLLRRSATPISSGGLRFTQDIAADVAAIQGFVFVGCHAADIDRRLEDIARRVAAAQTNDSTRRMSEYLLLNSIVRATVPPESQWVRRFAPIGGRTIAAERDVLDGHPDSARARLREAARLRQNVSPGEVTPDVVVPEARVWLALGDTASALAALESALGTIRQSAPLSVDEPAYNASRVGFLIQAYALRATLSARRDPITAHQSGRIVAVLWARADNDLQATAARLRRVEK